MRREWNHNVQYHGVVMQAVPSPCARALDVGCGQGLLTYRLAARCEEVVGIDMAFIPPATVAATANVHFVDGDVMTYPFLDAGFDMVTAVAVLHHLPLEAGLRRLRDLVAPGGVLAMIGLYCAGSATDYAVAAVALPLSYAMRGVRGYGGVQAVERAPAETLQEIRLAAGTILPGAEVTRRLFFRYSLIWRKPK